MSTLKHKIFIHTHEESHKRRHVDRSRRKPQQRVRFAEKDDMITTPYISSQTDAQVLDQYSADIWYTVRHARAARK